MNKEDSCEARIRHHLQGREEYVGAAMDLADDNANEETRIVLGVEPDADEETAYDLLNSLPLGVETYTVMRVDLSTGGPADWLEVKLGRDQYGLSVERVTYHFADWFDHAEESVSEDSPLWRWAENLAEYAAGREEDGR